MGEVIEINILFSFTYSHLSILLGFKRKHSEAKKRKEKEIPRSIS